jgi:hypothetical protein
MFRYIFSGWDGSTSDSGMYHDTQLTDLTIPVGKYFLADADFQSVRDFSFHIVVFAITSKTGVVPIFGTYVYYFYWQFHV